MDQYLLQTENLTKDFGGLEAVSNVNYSISSGTVNGLIGPNGSGKSTFINLLTGALPVTSGKILFNGNDVTNTPPHERVKLGMGRIFQLSNTFPQLSVIENVIVGLLRQQHDGHRGKFMFTPRGKHAEHWEQAEKILEDTLLIEDRDQLAANVPHGSMRRLEIAMAISTNPKLLLLDEPMAGLTGEEMELLLRFIGEDLAAKHTIIIIEHRLEALMRLAEKIAVLNQGVKVAEGTPEEIKTSKEVRAIYLGSRLK